MATNRLVVNFDEVRAGLQQLLEAVSGTGEAAHIVEATGNQATLDIKTAYPSRSGDLRNDTSVTFTRNAFGARAVVTNTSKHAIEFEIGTQARHTATGANRGSMPPGHVFVPVIQRARRSMYQQHRDLLVRLGLLVTGDV